MEFQPITASDYLALIFPDNDIVDSGILTTQSRMVIGGHPGIGKSILVTQMAIELARGDPFIHKFAIRRPCRVLIIQEEIGPKSFQMRLEKTNRIYTLPDTLFIVSSASFSFEDASLIIILKDFIKRNNIDIVIFDPLYKIHARRENDPTEMSQLTQARDRIINEFGISVILVHHLRQPFLTSSGQVITMGLHDFRGAIIASWADTLILFEETDIKDKLKVTFTKTRNAPEEIRPMFVKFDRAHLHFMPIGDGRKIISIKTDVMNLLNNSSGISKGNIANQLKSTYNGKATQREILSEIAVLKKSGEIKEAGGLMTATGITSSVPVIPTVTATMSINPWDLDGS